MKKIFAILSVVAMMFASCTPDSQVEVVVNFPETQSLTVESGGYYEIKFTPEYDWKVSLPAKSQIYATLTYTYEDGYKSTDTAFYGEAGVETAITVNVEPGMFSYAKDLVIDVNITMEGMSNKLAVLTIPKTPYVINVMGSAPTGMEEYVQSRLEPNGHPAKGPFASAANTYIVRYLNASDATYGDYVVYHDLDLMYNYVVYAKNSKGKFAPIDENCQWLELRKFTKKVDVTDDEGKVETLAYDAFSLEMRHTKSEAVKTKNVGYEAYVNLEDENGDPLVSVYFLYDPTAVPTLGPDMELAYPEEAKAKGVTLEGVGTMYTLFIPKLELLEPTSTAASLKITGWAGGGYTTPGLVFTNNGAGDIYQTVMAADATSETLLRENNLTFAVVNAEGAKEYTVTVILDEVPAAVEATAQR